MGTSIPFRRKSKDQDNESERKASEKDSVFKIIYKEVINFCKVEFSKCFLFLGLI